MTIEEMMICYKGTYCPIKKYMPNKVEKRSMKVWCLACSISKHIWNFELYCGKDNILSIMVGNVDENLAPMGRGELRLAHIVVLTKVEGLLLVEHVVVMDSFSQHKIVHGTLF